MNARIASSSSSFLESNRSLDARAKDRAGGFAIVPAGGIESKRTDRGFAHHVDVDVGFDSRSTANGVRGTRVRNFATIKGADVDGCRRA